MIGAIANPHIDILGHCTGRLVVGRARRGRPSQFDAELCSPRAREHDMAVEVNCRPERLDPPRRLITWPSRWAACSRIDTDAHAPGQLDWQP